MSGRRDRRGTARTWGAWTTAKLDALERYLQQFTSASKNRAKRTLYLDLFSGSIDNTDRATGEQRRGSAQIALETTPAFSRLVLCELDPTKAQRLTDYVAQQHPDRDVVVLQGDANQIIPAYLDDLARQDPDWRWAPTFALIDQYSADVTWATLEALSRFRYGSHKVELWMYFGDSFIRRGLSTGPGYERRVDALFGCDDWREIFEARRDGVLTPSDARDEYINLLRWRLQHDLGYRRTIPLRVTRAANQDLYTMIFATDHDAGERIMTHILGITQNSLIQVQEQQRLRAKLERDARRAGATGFELLNDWALTHGESGSHAGELLRLDEPTTPWRYYPDDETPSDGD